MRQSVTPDRRSPFVSPPEMKNNHSAAIVMAGGEGSRMQPMIKRWLGEDRPKQYCTYCGSRSMVQHSLDRAASITVPERLFTVIGHGHQPFLDNALDMDKAGPVIEQPMNRGTAPAIYLALSHIMNEDPLATVLILPSDLFVYPEECFLGYLNQACRLAEQYEDQIILLGAIPDRPETEYGWIEPSLGGEFLFQGNCEERPAPVRSFHEKPNRKQAERLQRHGALWNTMAMAVKARALWQLGWLFMPEMMDRFENFRRVLKAVKYQLVPLDHAEIAIEHIYRELPSTDFSRAILERSAKWCGVLAMDGLHWSDWGRPERIRETLTWLGIKPAF